MWDVVVVGGGPGGLYAARCLSSKGLNVAVVEEHEMAGRPVHCTGILASEAFEEFALPRNAILNSLETARFFSPSGQNFHYSPKNAEALVIDRCEFDLALAKMARDSGAQIYLGHKVINLAFEKDSVAVHFAGEENPAFARACVVASGASYGLQRQLGLGFPTVSLNTAQIEVESNPMEDVELYFGNEIAPQGFAWVVPVTRADGHYGRIGLMCSGNAGKYFERFFQKVGPRWGVRTEPSVVPRQKLLPLSPIQKTYSERLIVIGDAAALVKPTTGGGIYYSILSAEIGAGVLVSALAKDDLSDEALSEYETRWKAKLSDEFEAQLTLRLLAQRLEDKEIEALFELARTDGLMPLIRKTARFNSHRGLIASIFKHRESRKILFQKLLS